MNAAVFLSPAGGDAYPVLAWLDPIEQKVLHELPVPRSPNLGLVPSHGYALVSYSGEDENWGREWLDVYRLSDWSRAAHLPVDCRAHFNVAGSWTTFLPSPEPDLLYVYKSRTTGDHRAEDFIGGFDLGRLEPCDWNAELPDCPSGWAPGGDKAHAQMIFAGDGVQEGVLKPAGHDQSLAFWLGPEAGMGPSVSLGPRPRAHSDLGHPRAVLFAPERTLTTVVCTDGVVHLVDPDGFRYLERQYVALGEDRAMPIFSACIDPAGERLYVGSAPTERRYDGRVDRISVHGLDSAELVGEWQPDAPLVDMALTADGARLCAISADPAMFWLFDPRTGRVETSIPLSGEPLRVMPAA